MTATYQFLRPFAFLTVRGPTLDFYRWYFPTVCTLIACTGYWLLPLQIDLVGDKSTSDYLVSFFSSLPGFFIAALAAVVAFSGGDLDKEVPKLTVKISANGDRDTNEISLRVFLCYLFAYLTLISFVGFFFCLGGALLADNAGALVKSTTDVETASRVIWVLKSLFLGGMVFLASSIVSCTVQGLYFLAERVHQTLL
ncbi:hypothetical protein [Sinorhizobium meliloti]|uniref:hypothetical protein n=1 Tax=Rhizobium meliloti TaxID=382 RepID=UPI000FDA2C9E|nr:hypothetical protein [Sinorhizobium meliloti]RVH33903.1 hypothetical protein CN211_16905 [Sinorhizobium meliloti]